jgi:hypothetical protein
LSVDDLNRLCGERPKPKSSIKASGFQASETVVDTIQLLSDRVFADYPSLVGKVLNYPAASDVVDRLQDLPRMMLSCMYPMLRKFQGFIIHPKVCSPTSGNEMIESKTYVLQGTEQEMLSVAARVFRISSCRQLRLQQMSSVTEFTSSVSYVVSVKGIVTFLVDCRAVKCFDKTTALAARSLYSDADSDYFKVTVDLGLYLSVKDLVAGICGKLALPADCYCKGNCVLETLWELSEAQMVDPGQLCSNYLGCHLNIICRHGVHAPFSPGEEH